MNEHQINRELVAVEVLLSDGNSALAVERLRRILSDEPDCAPAHGLLALALLQTRRLHAAKHEAGIALAMDPESTLTLRAAASVALAQRHFGSARQFAESALALDPQDAGVLRLLARIEQVDGKRKAALQWLERAIDIAPGDAGAHYDLGRFHFDGGDRERSRQWVAQALALDPECQEALVLQGELLLRDGDIDGAREHAIWALRQDPSDVGAQQLVCAVKAHQSLVLGLWWRWQSWIGGGTAGRAILLLIAIFVVYQIASIALVQSGRPRLASGLQYAWFAFCLYTWVAPGQFASMLKRELAGVRLRPDF